jgi:tetratricopeptide (TPR) repeat protein
MKDFFISYNRADCQWAEWIAWTLEEGGYSTVLQAWDFRPGDDFVLEMDKAIKEGQRTILVLSPDFLASKYTPSEWSAAFVQDPEGKFSKLLPVKVRECKPEGLLKAIIRIELIGLDEESAKKALLGGVEKKRIKPISKPRFPLMQPSFPGVNRSKVLNIPHVRNRNFIGRELLLNAIHSALTSGRYTALTQAIIGLGGVGKTQLALEYSYRYIDEYDVVWWIRSEEPATLTADYAGLAIGLNILSAESAEQLTVIDVVRRWLENNSNWLLVFDNAQDTNEIGMYLPRKSIGHVIITSRNPNWSSIAESLPVLVFDRGESIDFICKRTKQNNKAAAASLAEELGHLPLALEQAGAYIEETGISLSDYLILLLEFRGKILEIGKPTDYFKTVATTWHISLIEVKKNSIIGLDLLNLFAFLAPDDIPKSLLVKGVLHLPESLAYAIMDKIEFYDALAALRRYSLIDSAIDGLSIHRLVQAVTRDKLAEGEQWRWAEIAVMLVNDAFHFDPYNIQTWAECSRLLPHVMAVAGFTERFGVAPEATGLLLNRAGRYLEERADFIEAKNVLERALSISEKAYGQKHQVVASILNNLGLVLHDMDDLQAAKEHLERALEIYETVLDPFNPDVALVLVNLGMVLRKIGSPQAARAYHERALEIDEKAFGPVHSYVARDLKSLGYDLDFLGDSTGAKKLYERGLDIIEKIHGSEHHEFASFLNNLGSILIDLGDLEGAKKNFERALVIDEKIYGPIHPKVAKRAKNLSYVLERLGDLQGAKDNLERALKIERIIFGPEHNNVVETLSRYQQLATSWYARGKEFECKGNYKDAADAYDAVIEIRSDEFYTLNCKGEVLVKLGKLAEAIACFDKAIELNSNFNNAFYNKGWAHINLCQYDEAIKSLKKAIEINPNDSTSRVTLAGIYRKQGEESNCIDQLNLAKKIIDEYGQSLYNSACFDAISGRIDDALMKLENAINKGDISAEWARLDPDLAVLQSNIKFEKLLQDSKSMQNAEFL